MFAILSKASMGGLINLLPPLNKNSLWIKAICKGKNRSFLGIKLLFDILAFIFVLLFVILT